MQVMCYLILSKKDIQLEQVVLPLLSCKYTQHQIVQLVQTQVSLV